jgi:hypothetical protein
MNFLQLYLHSMHKKMVMHADLNPSSRPFRPMIIPCEFYPDNAVNPRPLIIQKTRLAHSLSAVTILIVWYILIPSQREDWASISCWGTWAAQSCLLAE